MSERPTFRVPVEYGDVPDLNELFKNRVRNEPEPEYVVLDCCKNIPLVARDLDFELVDLGFVKGNEFDRVVRELDALGLRPIIYPELTSFIRKYPDESGMWELWGGVDLTAAGCYIQKGNAKYHPSYQMDPDSQYWGIIWPCGFGFQDGVKIVYDRFLATKKEA